MIKVDSDLLRTNFVIEYLVQALGVPLIGRSSECDKPREPRQRSLRKSKSVAFNTIFWIGAVVLSVCRMVTNEFSLHFSLAMTPRESVRMSDNFDINK
jgi:hypothetical protein